MRYLDPSLAVSLITHESFTAAAQQWLAAQPPEQVAVSDWVITEVSSALSIKQRTGDLDEAARRRAQSTFDVLVLDSTTVLDVPRECFARAAEMAGRAKLGLRSDDALHLAVAQHYGAQMCTRDERQAHAAGPCASTCSSWRRPNERSRDHRGRHGTGRARLALLAGLRHPARLSATFRTIVNVVGVT